VFENRKKKNDSKMRKLNNAKSQYMRKTLYVCRKTEIKKIYQNINKRHNFIKRYQGLS